MVRLNERFTPVLTLFLVSFYVWVCFFEMPYLGFRYAGDGEVLHVEDGHRTVLQVGDRILRVGEVPWVLFEQDLTFQIFPKQSDLQSFPLLIERGGERTQIFWTPPTSTINGVLERLNSQWWLAIVFLIAGSFTAFFIRPQNTTWNLLLAFNFIMAVWMATGSGPSQAHIASSALVLRSLTWLMIPVFLHLHWVFPQPLGSLPHPLFWSVYLLAFGLAVIQWFQAIPANFFFFGFLVAAGGSLVILLVKFIWKQDQRQEIRFLGYSLAVILIPSLLFTLSDLVLGKPVHPFVYGGALLAFPALPGAYFFIAYQRQAHHLGRRVLRLSWFYLGLIFVASFTIIWLAHTQFTPERVTNNSAFLGALITVMALVISVTVFLPFLALPALSGAVYSASRSENRLEIRANRFFVGYLFFILLGIGLVVGVTVIGTWQPLQNFTLLVGSGVGLLAALITAYGYPSFNRFVEKHFLGLPAIPARLLEGYAVRITTTLDRASLARLHQYEILPGMLIRQAALVYWRGDGQMEFLYTLGIASNQLPTEAQLQHLLSGPHQQNPVNQDQTPSLIGWVRVVLPLQLSGRRVGLWLLGRRDPDDLYTRGEIPSLEALAGQTAIALANIIQAEELRKLYQRNIETQEAERMALARELHDDILNQLAVLAINIASGDTAEHLLETYEEVTKRLRDMVDNLRPALLNYGLHPALQELVYGLSARPRVPLLIMEISESPVRYPENVETHIYRIVQQACENALRHAQAQTIWIRGVLSEDQLWLTVSDDGTGFEPDDLWGADSVGKKHYGLVGIRERAALIGARLKIESRTGKGTHISVEWKPDKGSS
ncbi:MAG: hypothetical protein Fur0022_22070 [Anaerolineales bacterium]